MSTSNFEAVRGVFSQNEWAALADLLNGSVINEEYRQRPDMLVAEIEDGDKYDGICGKWGISRDALIKKARKLTGEQTDALYGRIEDFWQHTSGSDIMEWAKF